MRRYEQYSHKGANFRICAVDFPRIIEEIKNLRRSLEAYIAKHSKFATSLDPLDLHTEAPEIARRMAAAAQLVGVGPMAAVAGTVAQMAAESVMEAGEQDVIVENGGDLYLASSSDITVGIYAGESPLSGRLAFSIAPERMPLALCSSSSHMGHSLSLGECDLATVASKDASLADAAATWAGNLVKNIEDIDPTLERVLKIPGIAGVLIVKGDKIGLAGDLPPLVEHTDPEFKKKITRDKLSGLII